MRNWKRLVRSGCARLVADRQGGVAVLTAMSLTTMLGFAGLGTEATLWYVAKRNMQGAADAAAFSAATAEARGQNSTAFTAAADAVASKYGYTTVADSTTVTVNNPPASGNYTTNDAAVEVIVSQPQPLLFSRFFLKSEPVIEARAVAVPTGSTPSTGGTGCVMALDQGDITDVSDTGGGASLNIASCSLYVNSSKASALSMTGGAQINALSAYIVGNYTAAPGAALNTTEGVNTGVSPTADPYASAQIPSYSGCNQTSYALTSRTTVSLGPSSPGGVYVFCSGLSLKGGATLDLAPGTYVINQGALSVAGGATINAQSGVTIILTSSSGSNYATVDIAGGTTVNVTAPTTGPLAGLAFYQDRNAPSGNGGNNFTGGTGQNITGAVYFPSGTVGYTGGATTGGAQCTQLIALTFAFSGDSTLNSDCSGTGVKSFGGTTGASGTVALVE